MKLTTGEEKRLCNNLKTQVQPIIKQFLKNESVYYEHVIPTISEVMAELFDGELNETLEKQKC